MALETGCMWRPAGAPAAAAACGCIAPDPGHKGPHSLPRPCAAAAVGREKSPGWGPGAPAGPARTPIRLEVSLTCDRAARQVSVQV